MSSITEMAEAIVAREGGFVDDPDDPGGATQYGVSLAALRRLGIDLTGDGRITVADVRKVSRAEAVELFLKEYYDRPRIKALPEMLQASVFDMQVNSGSNAIRILQNLLNEMGHDLHVDGVIGPQTAVAARKAAELAPEHLCDAYAIARRNFYYSLADARPTSRKYVRRRDGGKGGWITRAESFMSEKYRLSDAAHARRIAAWE